MLFSKTFVVFFSLCFVHECISKPTNGNELTEGRGIMSSIWGWITYPFSWWSSEKIEQSVNEALVASPTNDPNDIVDIRSHNVTIWCNDQTCTTMKCDKTECRNVTCNLYDTDFRGECREYNIIQGTEEYTVPKSTETAPNVSIQNKPTESPNTTRSVVVITKEKDDQPTVEEHPLELEVVLSSTVNTQTAGIHSEPKEDTAIHNTKV